MKTVDLSLLKHSFIRAQQTLEHNAEQVPDVILQHVC